MHAGSQKAPSAIRCIKTRVQPTPWLQVVYRQKAPSAIRCIKTRRWRRSAAKLMARQKAPSAIRCIKTHRTAWPWTCTPFSCQKAPSAIRCIKTRLGSFQKNISYCQKAPSAIRCIKTWVMRIGIDLIKDVRKHRAP